ncbi:MAG: MFS transporter [Stackebrandtia sp.]
MSLAPYRRILAFPGVKPLLLGGFLARMPYAAMGLSLILFVRFGLETGYFEAGLVGAAFVIGGAVGSTAHGRIADRVGIRPVLAATSVCMGLFWLAVPLLSYPALLALALPAGAMNLPVFVVVRQPLAAMIPEEQRRTAYALDSILVETTFMISPALATVAAAMAAPEVMPLAIGVWAPLAGAFLWRLNPPIRADHEQGDAAHERPSRRQWLRGPMIAMLVAGVGATIALGGTDVALVSLLEHRDQLNWAWVVMTVWAVYSLLGGLALGATDRKISPLLLLAVLGAATVPLGWTGQWWLLALALIPAGFVTAPTIASSVDAVSRIAPSRVRGEAMGMHGSAITVGNAVGGPLVGWAVDNIGVEWGFVVAGAGALVAAGIATALTRGGFSGTRGADEPAPTPLPEPAGAATG